ncbi:hypothetical protein QUB33_03700 [Microcoleus sp. B3-A4]|uniref:hypothetical protein n=1 Tax=Microcoleus sp. B3-A4 TaxID=2818653 RepID=UPI002FD25D01
MAITKQLTPALHLLTVLHITRTAFFVRLATPALLPARLALCRVLRLAHHGVVTVLSVSRNSFVRFSLLPVNSVFHVHSGKYDQLSGVFLAVALT